MSNDTDFKEIERRLRDGGMDEACEFLVRRLGDRKQYHELFDARLMQCRHSLGLPAVSASELDDYPEAIRDQLEEGYLNACREVGGLLLQEGRLREAWMYLRPANELETMRSGLLKVQANDENLDELIELAIYEGIDVAHGFQIVLDNYGTCNAITTFESAMPGRKPEEQQSVVRILLQWLRDELRNNLQADLGADVTPHDQATVTSLIEGRQEMFGEFTTYIDVSHLAAVVRFARGATDPEDVRVALDLARYGSCLHSNLQPAGDPPFDPYFESHCLFFDAQLGRQQDKAVEFFRSQAESTDVNVDSIIPIEVYVALLARLGRYEDAVTARANLIPPNVQTTGFAPSLLELSRTANSFQRLLELSRQRDDLLGFAVGKIAQSEDPPPP